VNGARLFVALEIPAAPREALAAWGRACAERDPALRAVPAEALHLTLHFLGVRPEEEIEALCAAVAGAVTSAAPCRGELAGPLWLAPRRPHVLTCAVGDVDGAVAALRATFTCPALTLMRSHPGPGGARYEALVAAPIGG
jgi:2'-5' RNA ligase